MKLKWFFLFAGVKLALAQGSIMDTLIEYLQNATFMANLPSYVHSCAPEELGDFCRIVGYLNVVKAQIDHLQQKPSSKSQTINSLGQISQLKSSEASRFRNVFTNFVLPRIPFKSRFGLLSLDLQNCSLSESHSSFGGISISQCLPDVKLPSIVGNDYLLRVNNSLQSNSTSWINFQSHWPSLYLLQGSIPSKTQQCPAGLHQVLVNTGQQVVRVRIFSELYSSSFEPATIEDYPPNYPLHHSFFKKSGFPKLEGGGGNEKKKFTLPKYLEVVLENIGDYVFIPQSYLVSYVLDGSAQGYLLSYCYVDASNLKAFLKSLTTSSLIYSSDQNLMALLTSPNFNSYLDPNVADAAFSSLSRNPLPAASAVSEDVSVSRKRSRGGSNQFKEWQELKKWNMLVSSLTLPSATSLHIPEIGRQNATLQWESAFVPDESDTTFFGFNITICGLFSAVESPKYSDSSCALFSVSRGASINDKKMLIQSQGEFGNTVFTSFVGSFLQPNKYYRFNVMTVYSEGSSDVSDWSEVFQTSPLSPPSQIPSLTVILPILKLKAASDLGKKKKNRIVRYFAVEAEAIGPHSARLGVPKPFDNGGLPLLGYEVFARSTDVAHNLLGTWHYFNSVMIGDFGTVIDTVDVLGLHADSSYEFKVRAFNAIGSGEYSEVSNVITTNKIPEDHHGSLIGSFHSTTKFLVLIDNINEHVSVISADEVQSNYPREFVNIPGWRCHWGPRLRAIGDVVWVNPRSANIDILNGKNLTNKIVLVERGQVPLVIKTRRIQAAGALGIIVVDDGGCNGFDQVCMPGSSQFSGEGFAAHDTPELWLATRIPVIFVLNDAMAALSALLPHVAVEDISSHSETSFEEL